MPPRRMAATPPTSPPYPPRARCTRSELLPFKSVNGGAQLAPRAQPPPVAPGSATSPAPHTHGGGAGAAPPPYDARAVDAWALGVMAYVLLTGVYPFAVRALFGIGDEFRVWGPARGVCWVGAWVWGRGEL